MEVIYSISVLLAGMFLLVVGIYGVLIIFPVFISQISKNLTNWLLLWMLFALFSQSMVQITLPMLPDISFDRVIWVVLVLGFFTQVILKRVNFLPLTKIDILMVVFCLVCFISKFLTDTAMVKEGLGLRNILNGFLFPFSIFFLAKNIIDNEKEIKKVLIFLLMVGIYLTFTGIFEHYDALSIFVFPRYILDPGVGIHWSRARGPFVQAAVNGMVLGIIFLTSYYLFTIEQRQLNKKIYGFFMALMPLTIYFTYTRSCWLGFFLSVTITAFYYRGFRKIFFTGMFVGIAGGIVKWLSFINADKMTSRVHDMNPIYIRINLFFASMRMFIEKPFFGFGFDAFKEFSPEYFIRIGEIPYMGIGLHQHDTLTGIMAELGLSGFLPLILIYFYIIKRSVSLYHNLSTTGITMSNSGENLVFNQNLPLNSSLSPSRITMSNSGENLVFNQNLPLNSSLSPSRITMSNSGENLAFSQNLPLNSSLSPDSAFNKYFVVLFWGSTIMFLINMVLFDMKFFLFPNSLFFLLAGIIVGYDQRMWLQKNTVKGMALDANSAVIQ